MSSIPPTIFSHKGKKEVHSNRFASKGIITIHEVNPITNPNTTYLSHPFCSPVPGFRYRSVRSSGSFLYKNRMVEKHKTMNQMQKMQPSIQNQSFERKRRIAGKIKM